MKNNIDRIAFDLRREPYHAVHNFVKEYVIPKYDCLTGCDWFRVDEMGNPSIEFFIRYCPDMPYEKEKKLYLNVIKDIRSFCSENGLIDEFLKISFFVTVAGDCS